MLIKPKIVGGKAVLLENVAGFPIVTCSPGQITVVYQDAAARAAALTWSAGTVLFTLSPSCNGEDERGVYVLSRTVVAGSAIQITVTKVELEDVIEELDISYGQLVSGADGQQMTSYTTTFTSYFTKSGTMTSSAFVSTITPSLTTMTYTSSTTDAAEPSFTFTPEEKVVVDEFLAKIPAPGPDGKVNMVVDLPNPAVLPLQPLGAAINNDPAYQATLQSAFEAHGFDSAETMNTYATSLLTEEGEGNVPADSPVQLEVSSYAGTPDSVYDSAPDCMLTSTSSSGPKALRRAAAALGAPRTPAVSRRAAPPQKRDDDPDGWDIFWGIMGDDAVGEMCDLCALA